jgi:hypothetical protein
MPEKGCDQLETKIHSVGNFVSKQLNANGQLPNTPEAAHTLEQLGTLQNQYKAQCPVHYCGKTTQALNEIQQAFSKDPKIANNPSAQQLLKAVKAEHDTHCKP